VTTTLDFTVEDGTIARIDESTSDEAAEDALVVMPRAGRIARQPHVPERRIPAASSPSRACWWTWSVVAPG
jgi:hypothetical protein